MSYVTPISLKLARISSFAHASFKMRPLAGDVTQVISEQMTTSQKNNKAQTRRELDSKWAWTRQKRYLHSLPFRPMTQLG